ncbi:MAG: NAD(P)-dependent oxidoreductase [Candidatus Paceibacterota bacterium]
MSTEHKSKWLVTGGAGFFGIHMCRYLAENGIQVVSYDRDPFPEKEHLPGIEIVTADIHDHQKLSEALTGVDFVIHAAAELALAEPSKIFRTNGEAAQDILDVCNKCGVKRLVFTSSCAVYGTPDTHPIYEDSPINPMGVYGKAKRIAEDILLNYHGVETIIIRPKSFIGTGRLGIFQLFFEWVEEGRKIPIFGNGENRFQLLEVTDLAHACYLAAMKGRDKEIYNVGSTEFGTVNHDLTAFLDHADTGSKLIHFPSKPLKFILSILEKLKISPIYKWVYDTADKDSFVSSDKAIEHLGWQPKYSNIDALISTYDWYLGEGKIMAQSFGTGHRVAWKQGIIRFVKYLF